MQDRLLACVQVVDAFSDVEGKLLPVIPRHLDLHVVQQAPQGTSGAVLEHNAQVGHLGAGSEEQDNVRMANDFHHSALVLELLKFVLLDNLSLDLLDSNDCVLPTASVHNTVTSLGQLSIVTQLIERNLVVLDESSSLVRHIAIASIVVDLKQGLFELSLQVLWIRSGSFKLYKDLTLIRGQKPQSCSFLLVKDRFSLTLIL